MNNLPIGTKLSQLELEELAKSSNPRLAAAARKRLENYGKNLAVKQDYAVEGAVNYDKLTDEEKRKDAASIAGDDAAEEEEMRKWELENPE